MKIIDLLDEYFFEGGSPEMLPILKMFAGSEKAEIFGISKNEVFNTTRVMIITPEGHVGLLSKYALYLGDNDGSCRKVGNDTFVRDEAMAVYGSIMGSSNLLKQVTNRDIGKAASDLSDYIAKSREQSKQIAERENV